MSYDTILVLDFGGQYAHLIARRIREKGVYSEIVPHDITPEEIRSFNVKGIILSGGPACVINESSPKLNPKILEMNIPILGICYGHQLLAHIFGGKIGPSKEYGATYVIIDKPVDILSGLSRREKVWMSHSDSVLSIPEEFEVLAHSKNCPIAAFKHRHKPIYGIQWHPEVIHTIKGGLIFTNFINICNCQANWNMENLVEKMIKDVRNEIGDGKAIIALSGGIDSSVAAAIASRAIGNRLTAVLVDHGFMREGEIESIKNAFKSMNLMVVDAKKRFFERLKGVFDPELKRKIIGEEFVRVFEEVSKEIGAEFLIQGTIYPDRIESGFRRHSDKIKSHHNVAGIPSRVKFKKIVEPLRDLYKDEVRKIALMLGLPREIVYRQPFPGPGLAVRVIGEVTEEKIDIVRKADRIVREEIERTRLKDGLWQYFAVLTNVKSTGVKGDVRAYGYVIAIRAVESAEAMTANFARIPYKILERISTRITNEIPEVVRVVYDITHKPPATIEWE
ncbi:MAG: glutamine-hydrolyzing GMP synthase [Candidatus Methanomethyliaceae archaeon]|nr:glutamine-hydrolyzing GMP synthase [Candidatus Methanomethyliaceae archaeon]